MPPIAYLESVKSHNRISAATPQTLDPATAESLYVRYDMEAMKRTAQRDNPAKYAAASARVAGDVALQGCAAGGDAGDAGRGLDADAAHEAASGIVHQGRGQQSDGKLQGSRAGDGRHDGEALWSEASSGAFCRQCGWGAGGVCSGGGHSGASYMPQDVPFANYVEGIVYGADVHMVDGLISRLRAHGGRRDQGAEGGRAARGRGVVRHLHAEGAVPRGGQEDDGL